MFDRFQDRRADLVRQNKAALNMTRDENASVSVSG